MLETIKDNIDKKTPGYVASLFEMSREYRNSLESRHPEHERLGCLLIYNHFPVVPTQRQDCLYIAHVFRIPALSRSKCCYLQSLLQRAKANALRLNELSHAELMYIAALTPTQLVIFKPVLYTDNPAGAYKHLMGHK